MISYDWKNDTAVDTQKPKLVYQLMSELCREIFEEFELIVVCEDQSSQN